MAYIVIVDDDQDFLDAVRTILEANGFVVIDPMAFVTIGGRSGEPRVVAIGAGCGGSHTPGGALSMNGHGVLLKRLGKTNELVGQESRLPVTFGTGIGKANFMGGGGWV